MVFQSYTLFPWLTVRQNVEYGLKRRAVAAARAASGSSERYLDEIGLSDFADHYPKPAFRRHDAARGDRPCACQ